MKLSTTTIFAILATTALTNAAAIDTPSATSNSGLVVKREDLNEVMEQLQQLRNLKVKREEIDDEMALIEFDKRAESVLGNLISALANSGLISQVFDDLTSAPELKESIVAILKATLQAAVVQGPTLIKGIWNSGLLQDVFKTVLNDSDLRSALLGAGKALFSTAVNLIQNFLGTKTGSSSSAATSAAAAASKREVTIISERSDMDDIEQRDLGDIISFIVTEIKDSGLVSSLFNKITQDPEATINFLSSALKTGAVVVKDVYSWAKSSGVLAEGINWLKNSDSGIISTLASFLADALNTGSVSADEFDNASTSATATVATTRTATATATAANTAAAAAAAAAVAGSTTTAAAGSSGSDDLSFLSKYAQPGATTLYKAKRMVY